MNDKTFRLQYTPMFEADLLQAARYIDEVLDNPIAAQNLLDDVEKAIFKRLEYPIGFEAYPSVKKRELPYYRIYVNHYTVFYVVVEDVMEIRRFLYSAQDLPAYL